ncbi:MAG: hypothetical protein AB7Q29_18830 [Vicinamibacterales bacterium]
MAGLRYVFVSALIGGAVIAGSVAPSGAQTQARRQATYSKDVAPILQAKCQSCHEPGSIGPMSLMTFQDSRPWARSIKGRVTARQMPPWHIDPGVGVQKFANDMSLTDEEIATIVAWVDGGARQGDPADFTPKPPTSELYWQAERDGYGPPDLVIQTPKQTMPPVGQDVHWTPTSDVPLKEPRWMRMVEIRPLTLQSRKMLHHVVAYHLLADGNVMATNVGIAAPGADRPDPEVERLHRRPQLMEWSVGKRYDRYPQGAGKLLMPGDKIAWDQHVHAVGEEITGGAELGIWFYPKGQAPKPSYLAAFTALKGGPSSLDISPNSTLETEGSTMLKEHTLVRSFQPQFNFRGRSMKVEAILPDGRTEVVGSVSKYDPNWITNYVFHDDVAPILPKGTTIRVTASFDNTKANRDNPDPEQRVGYGDRDVDETAHAWMDVVYLTEAEYRQRLDERRAASASGDVAGQADSSTAAPDAVSPAPR